MVQSNEWTLRRETVLLPELLLDAEAEQSIELDYVLPDYCPDFFRLLHCDADVTVTSQEIRDGMLHAAFRVRLRVLYCAPECRAVQTVSQQLNCTKQFSLSAAAGTAPCMISLHADPAYLNCRAVSSRRIDVRGALRLSARVTAVKSAEVLSGAEGLGIRTLGRPVGFLSKFLTAEKSFALSEDAVIPDAQPAMLSLLRDSVTLTVSEARITAGKLIVRGEAVLTLLYAAETGTETYTAAFPFSQIAEADGLTDDMTPSVAAVLSDLLLTPEASGDGELRLLHCDFRILLQCTAGACSSAQLLCDAFSTVCPVTLTAETVPLLTMPVPLCETRSLRTVLTEKDGILTKVCTVWAVPERVQTVSGENGGTVLKGQLRCCVMAEDADGSLQMLEQTEPFDWKLPEVSPELPLPALTVRSCTYTLSGADSVTVQTELLLSGQAAGTAGQKLLTDILPDAEAALPDADQYALRLCFGQPNETVWEIAKRYHTAPEAILAENSIAGDPLGAQQLLLIPNVR